MSNRKIADRLAITSKRVFGIIRRHVSVALSTQRLEAVEELSVDETSAKKGHNYVSPHCTPSCVINYVR